MITMLATGTGHWLHASLAHRVHEAPMVLITVAMVDGSGPRETGAKMLVDMDAHYDTIGGGHLELRAIALARDMLAAADPPGNRLERFALGPALGQCCGGVVHLVFELLDGRAQHALDCLSIRLQQRADTWRLSPLDAGGSALLFDRNGNRIDAANSGHVPPPSLNIDFERPCHLLRDRTGRRWLVDPCLAVRPHLVLFGAGHVGAAIVRALADLPCRVTWVDERDDLFPAVVPANVCVEATDTPECVADAAPAGSSFLVLTHSHALDLRLCEHILRRGENDWFGLIGSRTKRMQFERRLAERGIPQHKLDEMVCPIGLPGISGKQPAVIAASVACQLLQVWEAAAHAGQVALPSALPSPLPKTAA